MSGMPFVHKVFSLMEPTSRETPFDDGAWAFQVKWDGIRVQAHIENGHVELYTRHASACTRVYPEITATLAQLGLNQAHLDGEVVAWREGKPSFSATLNRHLGKSSRAVPATYMLFDILTFQDRPLQDLPWIERQEILRSVVLSAPLYCVDSLMEHGTALYEATERQGFEGIVAKRLDSPYVPGKSLLWQKIKHWRLQKALVCGLLPGAGGSLSLVLGAYLEQRLRYIGKVVAPGTWPDVVGTILAPTRTLSIERPHGTPKSLLSQTRWLVPSIVIEVRYRELTSDLKLRHPHFVGVSSSSPIEARLP